MGNNASILAFSLTNKFFHIKDHFEQKYSSPGTIHSIFWLKNSQIIFRLFVDLIRNFIFGMLWGWELNRLIIFRYYIKMSNKIDIEYCSGWGYGPAAQRLQDVLRKAFPDTEIKTRAASGKTSRIDVSVEKKGASQRVWSKNKAETDHQGAHEEIK